MIDDTGFYRYSLGRVWLPDEPTVMFLLLNPSDADANKDDPTVRRCIHFAKSWGYGGLCIGNLFALRSSNPELLKGHPDPVGPDNDNALMRMAKASSLIVAGWGNIRTDFSARERHVVGLFGGHLHCLAVTKQERPAHPMARGKSRIPDDATPRPYSLRQF